MLTIFSENNEQDNPEPKEGELYKRVTVEGKTFELYYGYYEDFEREHHEPIPLYPDFARNPEYTADGIPIVTGMQNPCPYYSGREDGESCSECSYFKICRELFGLCTNPQNRKSDDD